MNWNPFKAKENPRFIKRYTSWDLQRITGTAVNHEKNSLLLMTFEGLAITLENYRRRNKGAHQWYWEKTKTPGLWFWQKPRSHVRLRWRSLMIDPFVRDGVVCVADTGTAADKVASTWCQNYAHLCLLSETDEYVAQAANELTATEYELPITTVVDCWELYT